MLARKALFAAVAACLPTLSVVSGCSEDESAPPLPGSGGSGAQGAAGGTPSSSSTSSGGTGAGAGSGGEGVAGQGGEAGAGGGPSAEWSRSFSSEGTDRVQAIASSLSGGPVVVGEFDGTIDFGGTPHVSGGSDVFVLSLDSDGELLWSRSIGGPVTDRGRAVAVDSTDRVLVAGEVHGDVDFGAGAVATDHEMFAAKYDDTGGYLWSALFPPTSGSVTPAHGAVDRNDDSFVIVGDFAGSISFGGDTLSSATYDDLFIVKLDQDGNHVWSRSYGGADTDVGVHVVVDAGRNVLASGMVQLAVWVGKLDVDGNELWTYSSTTADAYPFALAVGPDQSAIVAGRYTGSIDFGGDVLQSVGLYGASDGFVAKLDASGNHVWSKSFGEGGDVEINGAAVDGQGNVALTGSFTESVSFGGPELQASFEGAFFAAILDADGNHLWSAAWPAGLITESMDLALGPSDELLTAGTFSGSVDFGNGPLQCDGLMDMFVAKIVP